MLIKTGRGGYWQRGAGASAPGAGSVVLPATNEECVLFGYPSLISASDGDMWTCDELTGNLIGKVRNYELAPVNGPSQGVAFGTPAGKIGVECLAGNDYFQCTNSDVLQVGAGVDFSISMLIKPKTTQTYVKLAGTRRTTLGWDSFWRYGGGATTQLFLQDSTGNSTMGNGQANVFDSLPHVYTLSCDRDGNTLYLLDSVATVTRTSVKPGDLSSGYGFALGCTALGAFAFYGEIAWCYYCIGSAIDRTGHDALVAALGI